MVRPKGAAAMKHPYIELEDWKEFVQMTKSEEAKKDSEIYKLHREPYKQEHCMGPIGYEGMQAQWDEEDRKLAPIQMRSTFKGRLGVGCEQGVI